LTNQYDIYPSIEESCAELATAESDPSDQLPSKWQNPQNPLDVNGDGAVTSIDALILINYTNSGQPADLRETNVVAPPYFDPNGDKAVTPADVLQVINYLNSN
jgi:hypothetical protein